MYPGVSLLSILHIEGSPTAHVSNLESLQIMRIITHRSEGFALTLYLSPGAMGTGAWPDSRVVETLASAS